jgi:hypothetical protein
VKQAFEEARATEAAAIWLLIRFVARGGPCPLQSPAKTDDGGEALATLRVRPHPLPTMSLNVVKTFLTRSNRISFGERAIPNDRPADRTTCRRTGLKIMRSERTNRATLNTDCVYCLALAMEKPALSIDHCRSYTRWL